MLQVPESPILNPIEAIRDDLTTVFGNLNHTEIGYLRGVFLEENNSPDTLTPQLLQILSLAASGLRDRNISERLDFSLRTVETYLFGIYKLSGTHNRSHAVFIHYHQIVESLSIISQPLKLIRDRLKTVLEDISPEEKNYIQRVFPRHESNKSTSLTPRRLEVLSHAALGLKDKEISKRLGISKRTVEKHLQRIPATRNRTHAVFKHYHQIVEFLLNEGEEELLK